MFRTSVVRTSPVGGRRWAILTSVCAATVVLVVMMALATSPALAASSFPDVPASHPYYGAITALATQNIVGGYPSGNFGPGDSVTRQQFAKMIVLACGYAVSENDVCVFTDVPKGDATTLYPDNFVAVCAARGITTGTTPTTFGPTGKITRYQVVSMVVRAADDLQPGVLVTPPSGWTGNAAWANSPTHGANAARAEYNHLLAGVDLSSLSPTGNMSRGEVAQILFNLLQIAGATPTNQVVITSDTAVVLSGAGSTYQFTAVVKDPSGEVIDQPVTWQSSHPAQIAVSSTGEVTSLARLGSTTITATSPGANLAVGHVVVAALAPGTVLVQSSDVLSSAPSSAVLALNDRTRVIGVGDTVVSGSEGNLFGKVTSVEPVGEEIRLGIGSATLAETFTELHIDETGPMKTAILAGDDLVAAGLVLAPAAAGDGWSLRWPEASLPGAKVSLQSSWENKFDLDARGVQLVKVALHTRTSVEISSGSLTLAAGLKVQGDLKLYAEHYSVEPFYIGPVRLGPSFEVSAGIRGEASASGAVTLTTPSFAQTSENTNGFEWTPQRGLRGIAENATPTSDFGQFGLSAGVDFKVRLEPYVRLTAGLTAKAGFLDLAALKFFFIQAGLNLSLGLTAPFDYRQVGYTGPQWGAKAELSAGPQLQLGGPIEKLFSVLGAKSDRLDWKVVDASVDLAASPFPSVSASPTTVKAGSVSFTARIIRGPLSPLLDRIAPVEGAAVDFVGFKDGASTYKVLATGTVHGDTAFGTWQPTAADNGTYHVTALLSHPMFGPAWPYSWSSKTDPPKVSTTDVVVAIDPEGANPGDVEPGDPGPVDFVLVDGSPRIYHNHHLDFWTTPLFSSTRIEARGTSLSARNEIDIDIPTGVAYFPSNKAIAGLSMLGSYDPQTGRMSGTYYWEAAWQVSFLSGHEWDKGTFWAVVFSSPSDTLPTGVTVHFDGQYCLDRTGQLEFSFPGHPYWDDTISTDVVDSHFTVHFTAKEAP